MLSQMYHYVIAARIPDNDETKNFHEDLAARFAYATTVYGMVLYVNSIWYTTSKTPFGR